MHISEGILGAPVLAAGAIISLGGVSIGIKRLDYGKIPETAILSSVFFVASLIHVPIGPSSIHLILNGLIGVLLGWAAFPAVFIALILQAVLFQFGGLTTLGVNTAVMAVPALVVHYFFSFFKSLATYFSLCQFRKNWQGLEDSPKGCNHRPIYARRKG